MHLAARTGDINVSQDLTSWHFIQEFPAKSKEATKIKKKLLKTRKLFNEMSDT